MSRNRRNRNGQTDPELSPADAAPLTLIQTTAAGDALAAQKSKEMGLRLAAKDQNSAPLTGDPDLDRAIEHGAKVIAEFRDELLAASEERILAAITAEDSPKARVLESIRRRTGRAAKTNRTCPKCGEETFLVEWSKEQPDGSTFRERRCKTCGHVGERIAPAEKEPE